MEQYIPKAAVLAEIESKIEKYTKRGEESDAKRDGYGMYWGGVISCLNEVRTLCDSLEVQEVDSDKWADTHQSWISVKDYTKDELPPLIDEKDPNGESVQVLFVLVLDGVQYLNKGTFDYDSGVWHSLDMQCSYCKENVTHWMPLPQPPKKGE